MQKTLLALVAFGGLSWAVDASALPSSSQPQVGTITPIDWYCGPNCQQRRAWRWHNPYYAPYHAPYHGGYYGRPYSRPYGYGYGYRGY